MQQVNLFVAELRPKKDWLSAKYLSFVLGAFFILLFVIYIVKSQQIAQLEQELEEKQLVLNALSLELDKSKVSNRPSSKKELEGNISILKQKIASRERLAQLIQGQTLDEDFSFYSAMESLAEHANTNVQVVNFSFSRGGKFIEMSGIGSKPYAIPDYLNRLRVEESFSRSKFGLINIGNIKGDGHVEFSMGYEKGVPQLGGDKK